MKLVAARVAACVIARQTGEPVMTAIDTGYSPMDVALLAALQERQAEAEAHRAKIEFHIAATKARLAASEPLGAFRVGDRVEKFGGSYSAPGTIVGLVTTRAGLRRYVFEFDAPAGMLHIFNGDQLRPIGADHE